MNLPPLFSPALALLLSSTCLAETPLDPFSLWPEDLTVKGTVIASPSGIPSTGEIPKIFRTSSAKPEAHTVVVHFDPLPDTDARTLFLGDPQNAEFFDASAEKTVDPEALDSALRNASGVLLFSKHPLDETDSAFLQKCAPTLRSFLLKGSVLCALGPVANHLGRYQHTPFPHPGLNLIPDSLLAANFDHPIDRDPVLALLESQPLAVAIGIPEDTAIVLTGRKIRAYGKGAATFLLAGNSHQPSRIHHLTPHAEGAENPYETVADLTAWRRDAIERQAPPFPPADPPAPKVERGTLIIVGGGGMPPGLMERLVDLAGGKKAKLIYVPCTEDEEVPADSGPVRLWQKLGADSATVFHTKDRHRAHSDEAFLAPLKDATGIWFGGGRQWNFADSYYGTKAHQLMKDVLSRGGVIGGSSAGASIQADYLARANPVANFDIMAPGYERGLGFITGVAIDQHFSQRGRQKDMATLVARHPQLLGIGIDEATALVVTGSTAEILGAGKVFFYDRSRPVAPDLPDHTALGNGTHFNLVTRSTIEIPKPDETPIPPISPAPHNR